MEKFIEQELKKYDVSEATIAKLKEECLSLSVKDPNDKENYLLCREAHQKVKGLRVSIEKRRKELKSSSLEFGRAIDGEARRLTLEIAEVEDHLLKQRNVVDDEKKRIQAEIERKHFEEEERKRLEEEAKQEAIRKHQEEREKVIREAEMKLESDRRAIELEKERDEVLRKVAVAEQKRDEQAEKDRIERERQHKEEVEEAKLAAANRAIKEEHERLQREQKRKERLASLKPDAEKVKALAKDLQAITYPEMQTNDGFLVVDKAECSLLKIIKDLMKFESDAKCQQ